MTMFSENVCQWLPTQLCLTSILESFLENGAVDTRVLEYKETIAAIGIPEQLLTSTHLLTAFANNFFQSAFLALFDVQLLLKYLLVVFKLNISVVFCNVNYTLFNCTKTFRLRFQFLQAEEFETGLTLPGDVIRRASHL